MVEIKRATGLDEDFVPPVAKAMRPLELTKMAIKRARNARLTNARRGDGFLYIWGTTFL